MFPTGLRFRLSSDELSEKDRDDLLMPNDESQEIVITPIICSARKNYAFSIAAMIIGALALSIIGGLAELGFNQMGGPLINSIGNDGLWCMRLCGFIGGGGAFLVGAISGIRTWGHNSQIESELQKKYSWVETQPPIKSLMVWDPEEKIPGAKVIIKHFCDNFDKVQIVEQASIYNINYFRGCHRGNVVSIMGVSEQDAANLLDDLQNPNVATLLQILPLPPFTPPGKS